ncbi:hypothetical protein FGB62_70g13 [Gracilaria domingensis]|nr:hypothetical protein FGB62_70g13 [Gracilaria domingensis]
MDYAAGEHNVFLSQLICGGSAGVRPGEQREIRGVGGAIRRGDRATARDGGAADSAVLKAQLDRASEDGQRKRPAAPATCTDDSRWVGDGVCDALGNVFDGIYYVYDGTCSPEATV